LAPPPPGGGDVDQVHGGTPLPIGTRLGDFKITGVVHQGSFGIVYAGEDRSSSRKIAVTEYLPAKLAERMADGNVGVRSLRHQQSFRDGKQRFLNEAGILAALDEPALVKVLRSWEEHGTAYMAMPLDAGQTLSDVLRNSPKPCEAWLKAIFGPLLDALAALHRCDCYPYDVTPDNIVVLDDGTPLLSAVGAARRIVADTTEDLTVDLNPSFAAIEQFAHDPTMPEGPWTDIYAMAAVLHFAIAGKPLLAPTARLVSDTLPDLRNADGDYSASFLDAVERGLAVQPGDRPQTISEFRAALGIRSITPDVAATARPTPSPGVASTVDRTAGLLPEPGPIAPVGVPEGTRIYVPPVASELTLPSSPETEQAPQTLSSRAAMGSSLGAAPWKLVAPLIVVGLVLILVGLGALGLLVWVVGEPRPELPVIAERGLSTQPVPTAPQPGLPVATPAVPTEGSLAPVAANLPVADLVPPSAAAPGAPTQMAARQPTPAASVPSPPRTGKILFSIKPWGEIIVDGKTRGVSPPIKELSIPEGRHRIEIRNGAFQGYKSELDIKAGSSGSVAYSFKAP